MEMTTASKALRWLANGAQYSAKRDAGYSKVVEWEPTAQGGAIVTFEDGTCETITAEQIAEAAQET